MDTSNQLFCVFCHLTFSSPDDLLAHIRIHTGDTLPPDVITLDSEEADPTVSEETISVGSPDKVVTSSSSKKESTSLQLDVVNCENDNYDHNQNFNKTETKCIRSVGNAFLSKHTTGVDNGMQTGQDQMNNLVDLKNISEESNQITANTDDQFIYETSCHLQNQTSNMASDFVQLYRVKRQLLQQFDDLEKPKCDMNMLKIVSVQGSYETHKQGGNNIESTETCHHTPGNIHSQSLTKLPELDINSNHDYPALKTNTQSLSSSQEPPVKINSNKPNIVKPLLGNQSKETVNVASTIKTKRPSPIPVSTEVSSSDSIHEIVQNVISSTVSAIISPVEDTVIYRPPSSSKDKFVTGSSECRGLQPYGSFVSKSDSDNVLIVSTCQDGQGLVKDILKLSDSRQKTCPKISKRIWKDRKKRFSPYRSRKPEVELTCSKLKEFSSKITNSDITKSTEKSETESKEEKVTPLSKNSQNSSHRETPIRQLTEDSNTTVLEKSVEQEPAKMPLADTNLRVVATTVKPIRFRCPSCKKGFHRITQQMHHKCKGKPSKKSINLDTAFEKLKMFKCLYCHEEFGTLQEKNEHHCKEKSCLKKNSENSSSDSDHVLMNKNRIKKSKVGRPSNKTTLNVKGVKRKVGRPPNGSKNDVGNAKVIDSEYYKYRFQCNKCNQHFVKESWLRAHLAFCGTLNKTTSHSNNTSPSIGTEEMLNIPERPQIPSSSLESKVTRMSKTSNIYPLESPTKSSVREEDVHCKGCQKSFKYRFNLKMHLKHRVTCRSAFGAQELNELYNRVPLETATGGKNEIASSKLTTVQDEQSNNQSSVEGTEMDHQEDLTCPFCQDGSRRFQLVQFLSMHTLYAHNKIVYAERDEWYFDDNKAGDNQNAVSKECTQKPNLKCSLCPESHYVFLSKDSYEMHAKAKHSVANAKKNPPAKDSLSASKNIEAMPVDSTCGRSVQPNVRSGVSLHPKLHNKLKEMTSEEQESVGTHGTKTPRTLSKSEVGKRSGKVLPVIKEGASADFIFEEAGKGGNSKTDLKQGSYKCLHCTFSSSSFSGTSVHLMIQHNVRKPKPKKISAPREKFKKFISVQKATSPSFRKVTDDVSICTMCDKGVAAGNIELHIKKHLMHTIYKCSLCDCSSFHRGNIKKHLKSEHSDALEGVATKAEANRKTKAQRPDNSDAVTKSKKTLPTLANIGQGISRHTTESQRNTKSRCLPKITGKGNVRSKKSKMKANDTADGRGSKGNKKSPLNVQRNESKAKRISKWHSKYTQYVKDSLYPYHCLTCDFKTNSDKIIDHVVFAHLCKRDWLKQSYRYEKEDRNEAYELAKTMSIDKTSGLYLCSFCESQFTKTGLRTHLLQHTGGNPYRCKLCSYKCKQSVSIYKHVGYNHTEEECIANFCSDKCVTGIENIPEQDQSSNGEKIGTKSKIANFDSEQKEVSACKSKGHSERIFERSEVKMDAKDNHKGRKRARQEKLGANKKPKIVCTTESGPSHTKEVQSNTTDRSKEMQEIYCHGKIKQHLSPVVKKCAIVKPGEGMTGDCRDTQKKQSHAIETASKRVHHGIVEEMHSEIGDTLEEMLQKDGKEQSGDTKLNTERNTDTDGDYCSSTVDGIGKADLDSPKHIHPCMDCDMIFESRKELKLHRNKHVMRMCVMCNFKSTHSAVVVKHTNLCHKNVQNASRFQPILIKDNLDCNEKNCDVTKLDVVSTSNMNCFVLLKSLSYQTLIKGSDNGKFNCAICGFKSKLYANLEMHVKEHYVDKAYHCLICSYRSSQQDQIVEHVARHFKDSKKTQENTTSSNSLTGGDMTSTSKGNHDDTTVAADKVGLNTCDAKMSHRNNTKFEAKSDVTAGNISEQVHSEIFGMDDTNQEMQYTKQIGTAKIKVEHETCTDDVTVLMDISDEMNDTKAEGNQNIKIQVPKETSFDKQKRIPDFPTKHNSADVVKLSHKERYSSGQSTKSLTEQRIHTPIWNQNREVTDGSKGLTVGSYVEKLLTDNSKDLTVGSCVEKLVNSPCITSSYDQSDDVVVVDCINSPNQKDIKYDMNQGESRSVWQPWLYNVDDKQMQGREENSMTMVDVKKNRQMDSVSLDYSDVSDTYLAFDDSFKAADDGIRKKLFPSCEEITEDISISSDGKTVKPSKICHAGQCTKDLDGISVNDMFEKLTNSFGKSSSTNSLQFSQNMTRSDTPVATSTPHGQMVRMNCRIQGENQQLPLILQPWKQDYGN